MTENTGALLDESKKNIYLRLVHYAAPYKWWIAVSMVAEFVGDRWYQFSAQVTSPQNTVILLTEITALADTYPSLRIVCTHIPPELESDLLRLASELESAYGARIRFAYDGMYIELEREKAWK